MLLKHFLFAWKSKVQPCEYYKISRQSVCGEFFSRSSLVAQTKLSRCARMTTTRGPGWPPALFHVTYGTASYFAVLWGLSVRQFQKRNDLGANAKSRLAVVISHCTLGGGSIQEWPEGSPCLNKKARLCLSDKKIYMFCNKRKMWSFGYLCLKIKKNTCSHTLNVLMMSRELQESIKSHVIR